MRPIAYIMACLIITGADAREPTRNVDAIKTMETFGRCVGQHQLDSMKLLATVPTSHEEQKQAAAMSTSACLSGGMLRFKASLLRGSVAEILIKNYQKSLHHARAIQPFQPPLSTVPIDAPEIQRTAVALILFGECVARQDNGGVVKLLATPVESTAEIAAFAPLQKSMTICSEATFKVDRFQMRGYLAEGAYRVAMKSISDER